MKKELFDIVRAITVVPFTVVKVTGNEGVVTLQSKLVDDESTGAIIFNGKIKEKAPDFDGIFGLSNINILSGLVNSEFGKTESKLETKISMKYLERNGVKIPEEIVFDRADIGKASYRLTGEKAIPIQMKSVADIKWNIEIDAPSQNAIGRFQSLASVFSSQETKFSVKTENRQLKFLIGDENAATNKLGFIFAENVTGTIKPNHNWNISGILSVLKLGNSGTTKIKINDQGIFQVEIDTGIGVYTYIFAGSN